MTFLRGLADYFKGQTESRKMVEEAQTSPAYQEAVNKYDGIVRPGGEEALKRYLVDLTDYFIETDGKEKAKRMLEDAWKCRELENAIAEAELGGMDLGFTLTAACRKQALADRRGESDFDDDSYEMMSGGRRRKRGKTRRQKTTRRHKRSSRKHRKKNKKTKRNRK